MVKPVIACKNKSSGLKFYSENDKCTWSSYSISWSL